MEFHLAPLKNISCWAFRAGIPGATDVYTEMIHLKTLHSNPKRFWNSIDTYPLLSTDTRQWVQLLSNNPKNIHRLLTEMPKFVQENPLKSKITGFNLNLGCPDPQIIAEGLGSCQLKQVDNVQNLIDEIEGIFGENCLD
ncbi:hypothetical protein ES708_22787 [subsurface metagenome]